MLKAGPNKTMKGRSALRWVLLCLLFLVCLALFLLQTYREMDKFFTR